MGKTAVPQANPGAMKQSGRERGRGAGGGALRSIGSSFTGGAIRHANERRHARKSGPPRVIATGSLRLWQFTTSATSHKAGLPREALPPAGRMATKGEEEHNASYGFGT